MDIEQLLDTKAGKQLAKDYQTEQDQERADLFTELDTIKDQRNTELQTLNLALTKETADYDEAQRALELAQTTKHTATVKLNQAKFAYTTRVSCIERKLIKSANPEIDKFCESLNEEASKLRSTAIKVPPDMVYTSSVNTRVSGIRNAVDKANKMKMAAVANISSELQQLYDALPVVKKTH